MADGATFVKNEFPDCAVVVEPPPNDTEFSTLALAPSPIAIPFVAPASTVAILPIAIPKSAFE